MKEDMLIMGMEGDESASDSERSKASSVSGGSARSPKKAPASREELDNTTFKISVVGVGGAGNNIVDNMVRSGLMGVNLVSCNTDAQVINRSLCSKDKRVHLGMTVTRGLGAGSSPEIGRSAAEESIEEVLEKIGPDTHMLFVIAGMGGGTGTGGAPVIARAAREKGILTVGIVTKPFYFEGIKRMRAAEEGIERIKECVDTLLVVPNQNLFCLVTEKTSLSDSFKMVDDVLYNIVSIFIDIVLRSGLVNLDFADISKVIRGVMGKAMIGIGESSLAEGRALEAAEKALACPLQETIDIQEAEAVLLSITGGSDMTLHEVNEAAERIKKEVHPEANILFGATFNPELDGTIRVAVIATGLGNRMREEERSSMSVVQGAAAGKSFEGDMKEDSGDAKESKVAASAGESSLGSRHSGFGFGEQHFSAFSLREENDSPFGSGSSGGATGLAFEDNNSSYDGSKDKTGGSENGRGSERGSGGGMTFLGKLMRMGRRNKDGLVPSRNDVPTLKTRPFEGGGTGFSQRRLDPEEIEVPAFLRKNKR